MLTKTLDTALLRFNFLRNKIDETVSNDIIKFVKNTWKYYKNSVNPYIKKLAIVGVDSSYNYIEFRGYALYAVNTVSVILDTKREEYVDGSVDIDIVASSNLDQELSLLSMCMEIESIVRKMNEVDMILVDGSLVAMFSRLYKASMSSGYEVLKHKNINLEKIIRELVYAVALNSRKFLFISKNSNSRDLLGLVKGDIYYFERFTNFSSGFSKPIDLTNSQNLGVTSVVQLFKRYVKNLTGLTTSIFLTYVRFEDFSKVYRVEFVSESDDNADEYIKHLLDFLSDIIVSGYPYPLIRAHNLAKISNSDMERIALLLGISKDPRDREIFLR